MSLRQIYDNIENPVWQRVVYDTLHEGLEFTNMAGMKFLDFVGSQSRLHLGMRVVDLCCGLGGTCRYIAERFRADVTGIEVNKKLVQFAKRKSAMLEKSIAASIHFECCDVTDWKPTKMNDVIFVVESLTLVDRPIRILGKAYDSLKVGGYLFIAEIVAGPKITEKVRRKVRLEDDMVSILAMDDYISALRHIGFIDISVENKTALAKRAFEDIAAAVQRHSEMIAMYEGVTGEQRWQEIASFYSRCFGADILMYAWITARRGDGCSKSKLRKE